MRLIQEAKHQLIKIHDRTGKTIYAQTIALAQMVWIVGEVGPHGAVVVNRARESIVGDQARNKDKLE